MRLREALLILSLISAFGCHSHASGPLVVVQCPGPELPDEEGPGATVFPRMPQEQTCLCTLTDEDCCVQQFELNEARWWAYDGLAERQIDVE